MGKLYIPMRVHISENGKITPEQIQAGYDGEWIIIEKVTDSRRRASLKVGVVGIRYSCVVNINEAQRKIYLF